MKKQKEIYILSHLNYKNQHLHYDTKSRNNKIPFTKEEDEKFIMLTQKYGTKNWSFISDFIEGRNSKQCRDRYSNYLIPVFFNCEWSKEEDELLKNYIGYLDLSGIKYKNHFNLGVKIL